MQGEMQPQRGSGFSRSPSPSTVVSPHLLSESAAAAVPNPHTQHGSEQHTLAVPEFRSLRRVSGHEPLGVSRAVFLSEGTRGECFLVAVVFFFFKIFRGCSHSLACGPIFRLQGPPWPGLSLSHLIALTMTLLPSLSTCKDPRDYTEPM